MIFASQKENIAGAAVKGMNYFEGFVARLFALALLVINVYFFALFVTMFPARGEYVLLNDFMLKLLAVIIFLVIPVGVILFQIVDGIIHRKRSVSMIEVAVQKEEEARLAHFRSTQQ